MFLLANKLTAVSLALFILSGCASQKLANDTIASTEAKASSAQDSFLRMKQSGSVIRVNQAKLAGSTISIKKTAPIPPVFSTKFYYNSASATSDVILQDIGRRTGFKIEIQRQSQQPGNQSQSQAPTLYSNSIEWNGTLSGLLDHVTTKMDRSWSYKDGVVSIFKTQTRTFNVYLPSGKKSISSSISLSGSGSSTGTVSVASTSMVDPYGSLLQSITAIVNEGAESSSSSTNNVVTNEALGLVTVTATPPQLDRIATIINSINERFAQNVLIGVKVYNLTLSNEFNLGASLDLAYQGVTKKLSADLNPAALLAPDTGTPGQLIFSKDPSAKFGGSSAILQALESLGKVSFVTSGQVIAANGQPSPLQVANEFTFLASSTTTQTANVGATTTLTPGTKTVGFTANFLPLILGDNRILLQYQINLSSLLSLNSISSGDSTIQIPNISTQSLQQQAFLKDGQSIVLFGFEQERSANNGRNGISAISTATSSNRNLMVIVLEVYGGK
jgi:type IVB pilus formation R64 PilN family outer membrane protein